VHIPDRIEVQLRALMDRFDTFVVPELAPGVLETLQAQRLTPSLMYEQLLETCRAGTQSHVVAVYVFLMKHYNAIIRGERPLPLDSIYRKLPFS
jgi:hypothetical protein